MTAASPTFTTERPSVGDQLVAAARRNSWTLGLIVALAALLVVTKLIQPSYGESGVQGLAISVLPLALATAAQAVVVIAGGIDLSIGSMMALTSVVSAVLMKDQPAEVGVAAVLLTLALGLLLGGINGSLVVLTRVPDIVVTLAMSFVWAGAALLVLKTPGGGAADWLKDLVAGSVGLVAVQTAKLLGAARVVAVGRSEAGLARAVELGADATVRLGEVADLVAAFKDAFGGDGPSYVFDPLWGEPVAAAVEAAVPRATIVNLGQSAGATAELSSAAVRFKNLSILGHTNFALPEDELAEHYRRLVGHVVAGDITFEVERVPLAEAASAWRRQAEGAGTKLVLVP